LISIITRTNTKKTLEEDLKFFGEDNSYFAEYKIDIVKKKTIGFDPGSILDFGCGIGRNIKEFKKFFSESKISGCDISTKSLEIAKGENPDVNFFSLNSESVNTYINSFDLIFVSCVFHHIEPELRKLSIETINSLLRPGGVIYIFEHNPYNPITQKIVRDCKWDADAILLTMKESVSLIKSANFKVDRKKYTLYFPAALKFLRPVEGLLSYIPLGGQYFVKAVKTI